MSPHETFCCARSIGKLISYLDPLVDTMPLLGPINIIPCTQCRATFCPSMMAMTVRHSIINQNEYQLNIYILDDLQVCEGAASGAKGLLLCPVKFGSGYTEIKVGKSKTHHRDLSWPLA